jgi:hypothetical protein
LLNLKKIILIKLNKLMFEPFTTAFEIYRQIWWIITPIFFWFAFKMVWINYIWDKYGETLNYILLEIKVPRLVEKSPKIMEQIFNSLWSVEGIHIDTIFDEYVKGAFPYSYSLEVVSFEGEIHFYIYASDDLRSNIEGAIYAQYPDAEIIEVDDYINRVPNRIPNKEYDLWGTEMILEKEDAYPIKTYSKMEDPITKTIIDPIATLVENYGKLSEGEQIWMQVLVRPINDNWKEGGIKLAADLIGKKAKKKPKTIAKMLIKEFSSIVSPSAVSEEKKEEDVPSLMLYLSPGEREVVEAVEKNISQKGFETRVRWMYIAKSDIFFKPKGVGLAMSPFYLFSTLDLNTFKVDGRTKTSAYYIFTDSRKAYRKIRLLNKYKNRDFSEKGYVLSAEELATLYHFPSIEVKAPGVAHVEAKKVEPPPELPI